MIIIFASHLPAVILLFLLFLSSFPSFICHSPFLLFLSSFPSFICHSPFFLFLSSFPSSICHSPFLLFLSSFPSSICHSPISPFSFIVSILHFVIPLSPFVSIFHPALSHSPFIIGIFHLFPLPSSTYFTGLFTKCGNLTAIGTVTNTNTAAIKNVSCIP